MLGYSWALEKGFFSTVLDERVPQCRSGTDLTGFMKKFKLACPCSYRT
jgi:hypothetical protein